VKEKEKSCKIRIVLALSSKRLNKSEVLQYEKPGSKMQYFNCFLKVQQLKTDEKTA
jgi:hypothetical protein